MGIEEVRRRISEAKRKEAVRIADGIMEAASSRNEIGVIAWVKLNNGWWNQAYDARVVDLVRAELRMRIAARTRR